MTIGRPDSFDARRLLGPLLLAGAVALSVPGYAHGQFVDGRLVPRGAFRFSFSPFYTNFDQRFALGTPGVTDGLPEPLGTDFTADTVGPNLFPTLAEAELAARSLSGNPDYRLNVGAFRTVRDGDIRRFQFGGAVGLSRRLSFEVNLPLVTTRSQVTFTTDSTDANVGWNQAIEAVSDAATAADIAALIDQLTQALAAVETGFGCPSDPACGVLERGIYDRGIRVRDNLIRLTGVGSGSPDLPPFAPTATSETGMAIAAEVMAAAADLQGLSGVAVTGALALPGARLGTEGIDSVMTESAFGFDAEPIAFNRQTKLGDVGFTLRYGVVQRPAARIVLRSTVRLPTGTPSSEDNFVDIGTGDGQTDVEFGLEAAFEPGNTIGISVAGSFNLQLSDQLIRRVTPSDSQLVPASFRTLVTRDLGDEVSLSVYPSVRLSEAFHVFASATYYRKASDVFAIAPSATPRPGTDPRVLERETERRTTSFGGGIAYRATRTSRGVVLPIEAGLHYWSAFSGSGGLTPKANNLILYLRLFYRMFGGTPEPEPAPDPSLPTR